MGFRRPGRWLGLPESISLFLIVERIDLWSSLSNIRIVKGVASKFVNLLAFSHAKFGFYLDTVSWFDRVKAFLVEHKIANE